jgi:DNA-binding response OmpR family regulator
METGSPPITASQENPVGLVLIANDHEWTARSVESILVAAGYEVLRAHTGQEALHLAHARRPDLFLLDQQLPDISGLSVCEALRADPEFGASTPVIITTAGPSGREQRLAAYAAGAWDFFGQPLDGEALLLKVSVFLASRQECVRHAMGSLLDVETGLYNLRGLQHRHTELLAEQERTSRPLCRVIVSVRSSRPDVLAHQVPSVVATVPRSTDIKGRETPHRFAILAGTDRHGGRLLADRLRTALNDIGLGEDSVRVSVDEETPSGPRAALATDEVAWFKSLE